VTGDEAQRVFGKLVAAFPATHMPEQTIAAWYDELATLDFSAAYAAARACFRDLTKWPTFAQFRTLTGEHAQRQARPVADKPTCPHCDGGWIEEGDPIGTPTVRPCSTCNRGLFERWQRGMYRPGTREAAS
jgi:hypothetical protein